MKDANDNSEDVTQEKYLSVIIPTYNEMQRLPQTLEEILPYLTVKFPRYEIIVVDDNSPDHTADFVKERAKYIPNLKVIVQPRRLGKGASVRRGCLVATGDYVLFMDADHSTPINELDLMVPLLGNDNASVVVGVRTYQEDEPHWRRVVGLSLQLLAHLIVFRKAVIDSQCGFKLFTREAVARLFPYCRVNGGMLDVELFFLMHTFNIPCYYQPVHWKNKPGSRINVIRCMIFDPIELLKIRQRGWMNIYERPLLDQQQPWKVEIDKPNA